MIKGPPAEDIQSLFGSIAHGYDKANGLMTFGMVYGWRQQLVRWSGAKPGDQILDCATGTGDLAFDFKKVVGSSGRVIGTDFCQEMLDQAPQKAKEQKLEVEFQWADAMKLPFADNSFDVVSISYGIRNVSDPVVALKEMARVCKPGGRVMILETGDHQLPLIQGAFDFYFKRIVPKIGGWVTGKPSAYEYLNRSSKSFPSRDKFLALMKEADTFSSTEFKSLMGGASFIYKGFVKKSSF